MVVNERKTTVKSIAFDNYLLERADELVRSGKFSSLSDLVFIAVTELLTKIELQKKQIDAIALLLKLQNNPECRSEIKRLIQLVDDSGYSDNDSDYYDDEEGDTFTKVG